jgi:hypothetical protein
MNHRSEDLRGIPESYLSVPKNTQESEMTLSPAMSQVEKSLIGIL